MRRAEITTKFVYNKRTNMNCKKIVFTQHAFTRMFAREVTTEIVKESMRSGEVIASYPDDQPYPSFLLLHKKGGLALHVVVGIDTSLLGYIGKPNRLLSEARKLKSVATP